MRFRTKRFVALFAGVLIAAGAAAAVAVAVTDNDPDTWNINWSSSSSKTTFTSSVLTVTCTTNTASGQNIGSRPDLGFLTMAPPKFQNCTDNLGGTDTVTVKTTGWKVADFSDTTNAACPSGTGNDETTNADCIAVTVPQNSTTIQTSAPSLTCTITTTPTAAENVGATVSDPGGSTKDTFTFTNVPVPFACGAITGTASFSGTYTLLQPDGGRLVDNS
jgi:hypothetical protein